MTMGRVGLMEKYIWVLPFFISGQLKTSVIFPVKLLNDITLIGT
jgi:hypothetical protein